MNDKAIKSLTFILLLFVSIVFIYFLVSTAMDGYWVCSSEKIDFAVTGQFGDFIGGFLGTVINGAAFYFLYLTLNEQRTSTERQGFETKFYELIHLHRENVSELRYTKNNSLSESRKVFRDIVGEFVECYEEIKIFVKLYPDLEILKPEYKAKLNRIIRENNCLASDKELAIIDIAFCCIYFGVSNESEYILNDKFSRRYNEDFIQRLKIFLKLKPRAENIEPFKEWKKFKRKDVLMMRTAFEVIFDNRESMFDNLRHPPLLINLRQVKYYGGHQHRLGHYFRHLFQSFKFISIQKFLSQEEKYFYAKSMRAQFSTYEQLILFFNSLSSMGMKWEFTAEVDKSSSVNNLADFKFITRYNLIKNVPGSQYYGIPYQHFYPNVHFEYIDDITYS